MNKRALGVVPFRGHVNRLCTRAGKTSWALKGKVIRKSFPNWLKKRVKVQAEEEDFWKHVVAIDNTRPRHKPARARGGKVSSFGSSLVKPLISVDIQVW